MIFCNKKIGPFPQAQYSCYFGSHRGIRTPVTAVRGRRPEPLDDMAVYLAAGPGFEPGQHDPESCVLPLHNPATIFAEYILSYLEVFCQIFKLLISRLSYVFIITYFIKKASSPYIPFCVYI